ncbi:P-loop NTPase fold protein [Ideonella sp. B508-1]|uniref:P-loop NTPase fold protein n=1 Tax=Ideonella sp. B508-1 TaxID=137716 RepID=UPI000344C67C|nr:P-loop NTPase fold protein [Ideonella sp. B508-1]
MTIEQSKTQLISLIDNTDLKVIALTGAWGTGKTHLWKEIRKESQDPIVEGARYVSLFGVKDINQLKLKVVQSALPVGGESSSLTEGLLKSWKVSVDALKKVHQGFSALDELALVAVPVALRNRFVVIDDIERKHGSLSVDEVLGFVDEFSQNFGTRFLLILNTEQFSAPADSALWAAFREKVVEEEIRFAPTSGEAFDIAVPDLNSPYRVMARTAVDACGITNIRVIRQAYRLVVRLLGSTEDMQLSIQARTVPSIVLISALANKAIKDGPTLEYVAGYNRGSNDFARLYLNEKGDAYKNNVEDSTPAAWKVLLSKLGINSSDEFEELVVAFVRDGRHDAEAIEAIIRSYRENEKRTESRNLAQAFFERFNWDVTAPDDDLVADAVNLIARVPDLDAYTVTALGKHMAELPGGAQLEKELIDGWLAHFATIADKAEFGESPFHQPLHERLKAAVDSARDARIHSATVVDAIKYLLENSGWGHREEAAMRSATIDDFETAMRTLRGHDFKLFVLKGLDILEQNQMYEKHFGQAGTNFLEACRRIARAEKENRFGRLLRTLFSESKVSALLAEDVSGAKS